jgi:3-hydroxyisobutyrate dehydrogenase-like beta-hydroxyacid dehydrogenase
MGLMLESASELDVPLPMTSIARQLFQAAIAQGHGEEDIGATIKVLESLTGVEVKSEV